MSERKSVRSDQLDSGIVDDGIVNNNNGQESLAAAEDLMGTLEAGHEPFTNFRNLMEGVEVAPSESSSQVSNLSQRKGTNKAPPNALRSLQEKNNFHSLPDDIDYHEDSFLDRLRETDTKSLWMMAFLIFAGIGSIVTAFSLISSVNPTPKVLPTDVMEMNSFSSAKQVKQFLTKANMNVPGVNPSLTWFFGFPQSGNTYVFHILHSVTDKATATNYGFSVMDLEGKVHAAIHDSVRVYGESGPALYTSKFLETPDTRILTWASSDGACRNCHPRKYMYNYGRFRELCWEGTIMKDGNQVAVKYNPELVKSAVHLYRDPFDNIVLRFWAEREAKAAGNHISWLERYPPTHTGFQSWCNERDAEWYDVENAWYGPETMKLAEGVICRQEFYKYIMFHNNIARTRLAYNLPTFVIKYEDFHLEYEKTISNLVAFMGLPLLREPPEKDVQVGFSDRYFTDEHRAASKKLMRSLALPKVLDVLDQYDEVEHKIRSDLHKNQ